MEEHNVKIIPSNAATSEPIFSVIIPTHNRASLISRAVKSVINQTFSDFELIVVDDVSTDNTKEVVESIRDRRIKYIRRDSNGGAGATRNTAIAHARGQFISLLDDDDEYFPEFLEQTYLVLNDTPEEVGFSWCGLEWYKDTEEGEVLYKKEIWQPAFKDREHAYLSFLKSRRIGTNCGLTFKKEIFAKIGYFDETFKGGAEDTDFIIRLVRQFDFRIVPHTLMKVHLHTGPNLRAYTRKKTDDYQKIIEKNRTALENHSDLWVQLHYKLGWIFYYNGDRTNGRKNVLQAIKKNPLHMKSWFAFVLYEVLGQGASKLHILGSAFKKKLSS